MLTNLKATSLSRRTALAGGLADLFPAVAIATASANAATTEQGENPELLALVPELDAAMLARRQAREAYDRALAIGLPLWPRAPKEALSKPNPKQKRTETTRAKARAELVEWQHRLDVVEEYERACAHANEVSGFPAANEAERRTREELQRVTFAVYAVPATTATGLLIKARAVEEWRTIDWFYVLFTNQHALMQALAADIRAVIEPS